MKLKLGAEISAKASAQSGKTTTRGSSAPPSKPKQPKQVWRALFLDYGYCAGGVPKSEPPVSGAWGDIMEWVTQGSFESERDLTLAIDIWMGRVDPMDYTPAPKQTSQPHSQRTVGNEATKSQDGEPSAPKKRRKFKSRSKRAPEAAAAPSP